MSGPIQDIGRADRIVNRRTGCAAPDPEAFLRALQLSDSALPIGRFVHSHGLEEWLRRRGDVSVDAIRDLVEATVCHAVAPLDGTVLVHAHAAETLVELRRLDEVITARKLNPAARHASQACGRQLSLLSPHLVPQDPLINQLAGEIRARKTDGNLAMVEGVLARALRPVRARGGARRASRRHGDAAVGGGSTRSVEPNRRADHDRSDWP